MVGGAVVTIRKPKLQALFPGSVFHVGSIKLFCFLFALRKYLRAALSKRRGVPLTTTSQCLQTIRHITLPTMNRFYICIYLSLILREGKFILYLNTQKPTYLDLKKIACV